MTVLRVDTIAGLGQTFGPNFNGDLEFNSQNFIVLPKGSSNQQGVLRTTEDVIGVGGTYYDNLVLALPLNEATQFKDVSSRGRNPGTYGNVSISSTISKYYGSSAKFDGTGDYIDTIEGNGDFDFEGDFTVEFWIYFNAISVYQDIAGTATNGAFLGSSKSGWVAAYYTTPDDEFRFSFQDNSSWTFQNAFNFTASTGTWYHVAYSRKGSDLKCFVNGTQAESTISTVGILTSTEGFVRIGGGYGSTSGLLNGHLQDLRVYKGIAKYTANFTPPERIAEIGVGFKSGALRYNTDSNLPELYDGNQWVELQVSSPNLGRGADTEPGARGLVFGGQTPSNITGIDAFNISSTGSAFEFGDLSAHSRYQGSTSSSTLAVTAGGANAVTNIDRTVFSSQGTSTSYGNLSAGRYGLGAVSNGTRAVFIGGFAVPPTAPLDTMDYITISSGGTAQSFGTLTDSKNYVGACASPVRGVFAGGTPVASPYTPLTSDIEFITTATLGNEQDFGNLTGQYSGMSGLSNPTRGVFAGGYTVPPFAATNVIDYITISTKGNASNFGDLTVSGGSQSSNGGASSPTRGVFTSITPGASNNMEMINIKTEGNSVDFGDLFESRNSASAASNAHGGL